jgi:hypothetical protein
MSPVEKGYFRKYSKIGSADKSNRYLELFDAIAAQKNYNEEALKAAFAHQGFAKQFAVAKHDLFAKILRVLREYHLKNDPQIDMAARLDHVHILYQRGLFASCLKLLHRTRKHAINTEDYYAIADLIPTEKRLVKSEGGPRQQIEMKRLMAEERENLQRIEELTLVGQAHDEMFAIISSHVQLRDGQQEKQVADIMNRPILQPDRLPIGFAARILYHYVHSYQARLRGDAKALLDNLHTILESWLTHPEQIRHQPKRFRVALSTYLDVCLMNDEFEAFELSRPLLDAQTPHNLAARADLFNKCFHLDLRYSLNRQDATALPDLEARLESALLEYGSLLEKSYLLPVYHNLMLLGFLTGHYRSALSWTQRILNEHKTDIRRDILLAARLFECLILFELGRIDHLESILATTNRFFQRKGDWLEFEKTVLQYLAQLMRSPEFTPQHIWKQFDKGMTLLAAKTGGTLLGQTEIGMWIKGKVK